MRLYRCLMLAALFAICWPLAQTAMATGMPGAASEWVETDHTRLRLVSAADASGPDGARLGLQFELKPGWKIYWRSPGDAGFPPSIDWQGSNNLKQATVYWPAPTRFSVLGLETLGYKDAVVLPISATPDSAETGLDLRAHVRYLACDEICIPYDANLALSLPAGARQPSGHAHLIDRFAARVPGDGRAFGLRVAALDILDTDAASGAATLRVTASAAQPFAAPDVFMEGAPGLAYGKPRVQLSPDGKTARMEIGVGGVDFLDDAKGKTLAGRSFTVTVIDGERAAEQTIVAALIDPGATDAPMPTPAPTPKAEVSFALILALAVIGGLILNLMPCVLPVLSLKMLSLVKHGGGMARDVRLGFIASAAGIITTFLALAGILATLRAGGAAIGWGIQFQQPWFLIVLVFVVIVFACNLWGFFEVRLPRALADLGGQSIHVQGLGGHFLGGVFATLLATPCTAPFLGTAVGFALAAPTAQMLAVFAALGVGLSLPYLCVAAVPALATWLPRPGPWMTRLKAILGVLLAGTGLWLLSVLAGVAGAAGALAVAGAALATTALLFFAHRPSRPGLRLSAPGMMVLTALALAAPTLLPAGAKTGGGPGESDQLKAIWHPFDPAAIAALVANGKTVFVDVTADWCITCQVNKGVVLQGGDVLARLRGKDVIAMQADWTRPNDAIARYLASFGRFGIPFNVVYGPGAPNGIVLPELLSETAVMQAFSSAAAAPALAKQ